MNHSLKTGFGSVCSVVPRIHWTFLPLDRAGNRRFLPIMIYPENAEVHILEDEDASRAYLLQVWAEAMSIYHSGQYSMKFSKSIQHQLVEVQKDFMPEDTEAGQIQGFLEHYTGNMVCSKQLFKEALGHPLMSRNGGSSTISMRS